MNIAKVPVDVRRLLHSALLISVAPAFEYQNGVRTKNVIGYKYGVLLPELAYEKINIKILGDQQMEVKEDAIAVQFEEVEAKIYNVDGRYDVSVSASTIKPAKVNTSGKQ